MNSLRQLWQKKHDAADPFDLDTPLLALSPLDTFSIRSAFEGIAVWGGIGSGKTSSSGKEFAKAYLKADFGGVVMCAKPEERLLWEKYADEAGRSDDLVIFSPENPAACFNFFLNEQTRAGRGAGQTENLVNVISEIVTISEGHVETGSGDSYWPRAMREMLRSAIAIISLARGQVTIDGLSKFIAEAPQSPDQISNEEWRQESFCAQCIDLADKKKKTATETHDCEVSARYFLKFFPGMSSRTRSSIVGQFTSCADILQHGAAWRLLCGETTTITPELTYTHGAIITLDLPTQSYGEIGRIIQGIFKYFFQRAILRRDVKEYPRPVGLWIDESQNHLGSYDFLVQATARSARLASVYLTQSITNYYAVLGAQGRAHGNALLGSFQTKIIGANSDHNTTLYAADLIAQHWAVKSGGGFSVNNDSNSYSGNSSSNSGNWNEVLTHKVQPAEFTTLRRGGPANNMEVDAIVFQGGRIWKATGETYLRTVFRQS